MTHQTKNIIYSASPSTAPKRWYEEEWVKDVFNEIPAVTSLGQLPDYGSFHYDYFAVVRVGDVFFHRLFTFDEFSLKHINAQVRTLMEVFPNQDTRWLEGIVVTGGLVAVINRSKLGLEEPSACPSPQEVQKQLALEEHGEWMKETFDNLPGVKCIVKSSRVPRSPVTFAIVLDGWHTWMKSPTYNRIRIRMKTPKHAQRSTPPHEIWTAGEVPADQLGIMFTRDDFPEAIPTIAQLVQLGRFSLRMKASNLGMLALEEDKMDFFAMSAEGQACAVYAELRRQEVARQREERIAAGLERRTSKGESLNEPSKRYADSVPPVAAASRDAYEEAHAELKQKLIANGHRNVEDPEQAVAEAMAVENHAGDAWKPSEPTYAGRLLAGLEGEVITKVVRHNPKFDPRPGIDDVGLGFSSPTWED